jgi:hypothetical protein
VFSVSRIPKPFLIEFITRSRMTRRRAHHQAAGGEGLKARAHGLQADLLPGVGKRCGQPVGALWALAQQVEDLEVYVGVSIVGVHSAIMPVWRLREAPIRREARSKGPKSPSEMPLSTPLLWLRIACPIRRLWDFQGPDRGYQRLPANLFDGPGPPRTFNVQSSRKFKRFLGALTCFVPWSTYTLLTQE